MILLRVSFLLICGLLFFPSDAAAHAFGTRYDLPLPLSFYLYSAGLAVAASFIGAFLIFAPRRSTVLHVEYHLPNAIWKAITYTCGFLGLTLLLVVLVTSFTGPSSPTKNFSTVFIWVLWWVGFVLFSSLAVNVWPVANPIKILANIVIRKSEPKLTLPDAMGWIAVVGLLFISWLELVSDMSEEPATMFWLIVIYLISTLLVCFFFGTEEWLSKCDPLTRLFSYVGKLAPVAINEQNQSFILRVPGQGLSGEQKYLPGSELFIISLIALVMFDGISETRVWQSIIQFVTESMTLRPWLLDMLSLGINILKLLKTLGILTLVLVAFLAYRILVVLIWLATRRRYGIRDIAWTFVASLLPIAIAYHLAHYVSYLLLAGQLIIPILNDPFTMGWDLLGTSAYTIDLSVINAEDVWWIAITAIVSGHIISVFVAHAEAVRFFGSRFEAIVSQLPMAVFMIGLTMCSLWILSQPIVL